MIVFPAIDILQGQVVRLKQGDFTQVTIFPLDPVAACMQIADAGHRHMHLVDLSGAKDPKQRQLALIRKILHDVDIKVQVGGGLRSLTEAEELLKVGADHVVFGSIIITQPEIAAQALKSFGAERVTFAVDVQIRGGKAMVMTRGWTESSGSTLQETVRRYPGLKRILCTDIDVDGLMAGPNVEFYRSLRQEFPDLEIQASGGIAGIADLRKLREIGVHSAVVGRALLSGAITLEEALQDVE